MDVDEVTGSADLAAWSAAHRTGGGDALGGWLDERALADGCLRLYIVRVDESVVATAAAYGDDRLGLTLIDVCSGMRLVPSVPPSSKRHGGALERCGPPSTDRPPPRPGTPRTARSLR